LLFQDNAKKAGVDIKMEIKEGRNLLDAIYNHDYESSASAAGFSLAPYDPYQRWHSDNSTVKKGNVAGYVNERNDELIATIRTTKDPVERKKAYMEFQELMYEEQPVIFLYSPAQKFVLNKKYTGLFSMKRPGYFVGSFELALN
jgi:peptide/nickel transport system substrate-binding protein